MAEQSGASRIASLESRIQARRDTKPVHREDYGVTVLPQARQQLNEPIMNDYGGREFSAAMELVREASEAARINDARIADLESEVESVRAEGDAEILRLQSQLQVAQARISSLEEQVQAAETRASTAAMWLSRLNEAITASFSPVLRRDEQSPADWNGPAPVKLR